MVEIRRDSLTGNVLDKTVLDTVVMGLGKESQTETGNRLLIASDDDVTDRDKTTTSGHYSWEADDAELMQRMREYNLGSGGGGGASNIDGSEQQSMMPDTEDSRNVSPKQQQQQQQAISPPTSSPYIASTGVCSSNPPPIIEQDTKTYEPLTRRRSSIKFDYDMVDYDNPVMPSVRDNEDDDVSYTVGDISGASSRKLFEVEHDHTADEQPLDLIHLLAMRRAHMTEHGDNDDVTSSSSGAMMYHPPEPAAACRASYMGVGETFLVSDSDKDESNDRDVERMDTTSDEQRQHSRKQSGAASTISSRRDASKLRVKTGSEEKKYRSQ